MREATIGLRMGIRRSARAFLVMVLATVVSGMTPPASAQTPPAVQLRLQAQTPWVAPDDPTFRVVVAATNEGDRPLRDLDLRIAIGPFFQSRFEYETSLVEGSSEEIFAEVFPFRGVLDPGDTRTFRARLDLTTVDGLSRDDSRVYPLLVEIRSDGTAHGGLRSSLISIVRQPERPLLFAWWTEFDTPPGVPLPLDADGRLADPGFEASIAPGGTLAEQARILRELTSEGSAPIDVVVRPALLEQLARMREGYERTSGVRVPAGSSGAVHAASVLAALSAAVEAPNVQASAVPYAGPSLPALLASGLALDLERQRSLGDEWTDRTIGVPPATSVARPPGGSLSDPALTWLAARGVTTILADPTTVERPEQPNQYAPPATATVATTRGEVSLVLPDPATQGLLVRADLLDDPVRAAQAVLGELALIWKEQPAPPPQPDGTPTQRGVALRLPSDLRADLWEPLMQRLADVPFLTPVHAQELPAGVNPPGEPATLRAPSFDAFDETYAGDLRDLRRDVETYASILTEPGAIPARLLRDVYVAESYEFLADPIEGRTWIDGVRRVTELGFSRTKPEVQVFTLTSEEGVIPLRMGDPGPVPLQVTVQLQSSRFDFPDGNEREVLLDRPNQIVSFRVVSKVRGNNPIQVRVLAPSGRVISDERVVVVSTGWSRIALVVTGTAAFMLVLLWLRRWFRRRTD